MAKKRKTTTKKAAKKAPRKKARSAAPRAPKLPAAATAALDKFLLENPVLHGEKWDLPMNADQTVGHEAHGVPDGEHVHRGMVGVFSDGRLTAVRRATMAERG